MLQCHLYQTESAQWRTIDFSVLKLPLHGDEKLWIDLSKAEIGLQQQLLKQLQIHPELAEDYLRDRHPPKIESGDLYTLILLRAFAGTHFSEYPGHAQLSLLFSKQIVLYKCQLPSDAGQFSLPAFEIVQPNAPLKDSIKHYIHAVSASYLEKLIAFEQELGELEDEMLTQGNDIKMTQIMRFRSVFRKLERNLAYQKEMFADFHAQQREHRAASEFHAIELRDFYEKFERLHSMTQMYYDQLGDLVSAYMSTSSHQINERMKVLTMVSTLFIPLTFIVGIYGMNFEHMPELSQPSGYFWTLGGMSALALSMLAVFKLKKWW